MKALNYKTFLAHSPCLLDIRKNSMGQEIAYYEHPFLGDEEQIIAVHHESKRAVYSGFYDLGDQTPETDYMPLFLTDKVCQKWEK